MRMLRHVLLLLGTAVLAASSVAATPQGATGPDELGIWSDPTFQRQFLGSYGIRSEVEPQVSAVEREQLEELLDLMKAGDTAEALAKAAEYGTADASAIFDFLQGNLHMQDQRFEDAAVHYRTAVDKFPAYLRAHKNLGVIAVRLGRLDDAIGSLARVIELGGADGTTFGLLGYAYSNRERYVSAESAYRSAVLLEPDVRDWQLGLLKSVFRQRKYPEALALSRELLEEDPDQPELWTLEANAWIGLEQPMEAARIFELLLRMGQASPAALYTLGDIYVNESLWDLAERAYGRAIEAETSPSVDRALRSVEALAGRGALEPAASLLGRVRTSLGDGLDDDARRKLLKLEARIAVAGGDGGDAVHVLEEIVGLDPLDGEALILLGQHWARNDDPDRAIFYFERAASLDEHAADAMLRHAQVLVDGGRYQEALPLLERRQQLAPRDDVARYIEQVERVARTRR